MGRIMAIWARIKNLKFKQLLVLAQLSIQHPTSILPTYKATKNSMAICDRRFGNAHHKDNETNAFRHALWNFLIAEYCFRGNDSVKKSVNWAKRITDLHERLSPNELLAKTMDLHNNQQGRVLFEEGIKEEQIVSVLQQKMKKALKIVSPEDAKKAPQQLIYIAHER
ncbi:hypothetical protein RBU60_03485 [Mesonia sp. MT50]|uniref:DUF6973 domain-containing protein n=1 Tax=Mesonia profundi TaxID=3070998 RepID=A0ABU0ZYT4_9FLAO|nr:hypothetical protein [Mesonia profundi]MDQ7916625.1 hypothetical protein [Mesonia profundi]